MDELTLDGEVYVSTKRAAKITGYAKDYVGQLCREGRVKARLVGRNWYVLESSIREHRFGEEAAPEKVNKPAVSVAADLSDWKPSHYASETHTELPVLEKPVAELPDLAPVLPQYAPEYDAVSSHVDTSEVVKEMQSAWQDWFKREDLTKVAQEVANEELLEAPEPQQQEEPTLVEEEAVPVTIHREIEEDVPQVIEHAEDTTPVAMYRSYSRPEPVQAPVTVASAYSEKDYTALPSRHTKKNKRQKRSNTIVIRENTKSSLILKAIFVAVIFITLAVAAIGSGYLDGYISQASLKYYPLQYLGGERVLNK